MNIKQITQHKRIYVVIPAYNESQSISQVVRDVLKNTFVTRCIVVDDGSTDDTGTYAKKAGAIVLRLPENGGVGRALKVGMVHAYLRHADYVITLDADGQHSPAYIPKLLQAIDNTCEYVIASRYVKQTPRCTQYMRALATKIISLAIEKKHAIRIYDATSGFRLISRRVVRLLSKTYPDTFSEPEIILQLIERKILISEISVPMLPRKYGRSTISFIKGVYMLAYILVKIILSPTRRFSLPQA